MTNSNRPGGDGNREPGDAAGVDRRTVLKSAMALSAFGSSLVAWGADAQGGAPAYHRLGVAEAAAAIRRGEISAEAYAAALLTHKELPL